MKNISAPVFIALLLTMVCGACTPARESTSYKRKDDAHFETLLKLNDLNERAFAYHQHCLASSEPMDEDFLKNFEITTNLLFDEGMETLGWKPEYISAQIIKRRDSLQGALNQYYQEKGCTSLEANAVQDHYSTFGNLNKNQIKNVKEIPFIRR